MYVGVDFNRFGYKHIKYIFKKVDIIHVNVFKTYCGIMKVIRRNYFQI